MNNSYLRSKPQSPIFKESIEQFGRELSNFFYNKDYVPSFLLKADDDLSDVGKLKDNEHFAIPLWTYRLDSLSPNREKFNRSFLRRNGLVLDRVISRYDLEGKPLRPEDPNKFYHTLHLSPADLTLDVAYYCSADDMYDFGPMWQQAAQDHYLNFQLEVGEEQFVNIKCELSEDVTFSGLTLDDNQYTQFVSSVVMSTYHGVMSDIKPINSYALNTGLVDKQAGKENSLSPVSTITRKKDSTVFVKRTSGA
jgi:hypothetical protein